MRSFSRGEGRDVARKKKNKILNPTQNASTDPVPSIEVR